MQFNSILLAAADNAGMMNILFIVVLIAIFYFLMIRPQNKKQKEIRKFREGLQSGDKAGGIFGKIKEVKDTYILLEIADNVRIRVDKGSIYPSAAEAGQANTKEKE